MPTPARSSGASSTRRTIRTTTTRSPRTPSSIRKVNGKFVRATLHCQPQRLRLRAGSQDRRVPVGHAVRGQAELDAAVWTPRASPSAYDPEEGRADLRAGYGGRPRHRDQGARRPWKACSSRATWAARTGRRPRTARRPTCTTSRRSTAATRRSRKSTIPGEFKHRQLFLGGAPFSTFEDPECGRIWGSDHGDRRGHRQGGEEAHAPSTRSWAVCCPPPAVWCSPATRRPGRGAGCRHARRAVDASRPVRRSMRRP